MSASLIESSAAQMKSQLSEVLARALPDALDGKVKLLEAHLRQTLEGALGQPTAPAAITRDNLSDAIRLAREAAGDFHQQTRDIDPCHMAVAEGLAAITFGSVLGPHAALVGFGVGVFLLTQSCHEGG